MSRAKTLAQLLGSDGALTVADVSGAVNKAGDTLTGPLTMSGTQIVQSGTGFAGTEYHNGSGWESYVGTEYGTGNLRFHSRIGIHNWYSNGVLRMTMDGSGRLLKPYHPAWNVGLSTNQTIVNGSTILWNQSSGSDCFISGGISLNSSNGRITVPVDGKYLITSSIRTESTGASNGTNINLRRNGSILQRHYVGGSVNSQGSFMYIEPRPYILQMAAGDYIDFNFDACPTSFELSNSGNTVVRFFGTLIG